MLFSDPGSKVRLLLAVRVFFPLVLLALATIPWAAALGQTPASPPIVGLPPPDIKAEASLNAALTELDRSAATVVAEVNERPVTWGDVADTIRAMPTIVSAIPFQQLYQNATVQVMQQKALVQIGETTGLDKDRVVQRRMKNAAEQVMASEVLRRSLAPNITDQALRAVYDGVIAGKPGADEVQARIIMVDTKEEAIGLIQQLQVGGDFSALARRLSKDGTASSGGELGYAKLDMLAPEIGSVMFALAPGQMTAFPVRSSNSWFIIKIEGRRQPPTPSFAEARPALERDIIHAGMPELMRMALQPATVKYHGLAGKKQTDEPPK